MILPLIPDVCCTNCEHYSTTTNICKRVVKGRPNGYTIHDPNMVRLYCQSFIAIDGVKQKEEKRMTTKYLNIQIDIVEEIRKLITDNLKFNPDDWSERDADILYGAASAIMEGKIVPIEEKKRTLMILNNKEGAYGRNE